MYKVIKDFKDLKDNKYVYRAGDIYPKDGKTVNKKRMEELSSENNLRKEILIKEVECKSDENNVETTNTEVVNNGNTVLTETASDDDDVAVKEEKE